MKSNFHVRGALRVEYRIQAQKLSDTTSLIASEQRFAGGDGAVGALALVALGAHVRLSANAIGNDSHGRFLWAQLQGVPNLELDVEVRDDVVTPYAILTRDDAGNVQTLLSPEAARLEGEGDYPQLLLSLRSVLTQWTANTDTIERLVANYDNKFGVFTP